MNSRVDKGPKGKLSSLQKPHRDLKQSLQGLKTFVKIPFGPNAAIYWDDLFNGMGYNAWG